MKRLIIALALLMPTYALATPTNYEILSKGRILSEQAFDGLSRDHSFIVYYQDTIWKCEIKYTSLGCAEASSPNFTGPAQLRRK